MGPWNVNPCARLENQLGLTLHHVSPTQSQDQRLLVGSIVQDSLLGWETPICDLPRVTITTHSLPPKKGFIKNYRVRAQHWARQDSDPSPFPPTLGM